MNLENLRVLERATWRKWARVLALAADLSTPAGGNVSAPVALPIILAMIEGDANPMAVTPPTSLKGDVGKRWKSQMERLQV